MLLWYLLAVAILDANITNDFLLVNNQPDTLFDVITSFPAVYIWSWTTAHRDTRRTVTNDVTAGGGPLL